MDFDPSPTILRSQEEVVEFWRSIMVPYHLALRWSGTRLRRMSEPLPQRKACTSIPKCRLSVHFRLTDLICQVLD